MKKETIIISLLVIAIAFAIGIYFYPQMPESMASHWNIKGEVDGYLPKCWGLFLMPIVSLGMFLLFIAIPYLDPLKKNIEKFRKYYDGFILAMILFLLYIYLISLFWNLGYQFNMGTALIPALGLLWFYIGTVLEHTKQNWFIGIRTPWTLSSKKVWKKTHKLAGKLFKLSAIVAFCGLFFMEYSIWFVMTPILLSIIYIIPYSYVIYKK